ncbi:MAG TPA: hypothetical protein G4O01_02915 [Dehalococcoidia bacterium]|jgi:hypothetical protein|nr:hypothetical protein [Dehalococcoidia bacterium]
MKGQLLTVLDEKLCRDFKVICSDCGSLATVYGSIRLVAGRVVQTAYCYGCLLRRCKRIGAIPFPIEATLLDRLQADLGDDQPGVPAF